MALGAETGAVLLFEARSSVPLVRQGVLGGVALVILGLNRAAAPLCVLDFLALLFGVARELLRDLSALALEAFFLALVFVVFPHFLFHFAP